MRRMLFQPTLRARLERAALQAASERLRRQGLIVELEGSVVRYPDREAALDGRLTPQAIRDARLIARRHLVAAGAA